MDYAINLASALDLRSVDGPDPEWLGERGGLSFGLSQPGNSLLRAGPIRMFCIHASPLRMGLLLQSMAAWGGSDPFDHLARAQLTGTELDERVVMRAAEPIIARTLIKDAENTLTRLLDGGTLSVDDQRVWLTLPGEIVMSEALTLADRMVALSDRLSRRRVDWEADFETAIGPVWSRHATTSGMRWNADRSRIDGEAHGATVEVRVDGEPGVLYTEIYVEWPELDTSLDVVRSEKRGTPGERPPDASDETMITEAFDRVFEHDGDVDALGAEGRRAALSIAAMGASLTIDDTGLVARVDHVVTSDASFSTLFHGVLAITKAIRGGGPTGLYR